MDGRDRSVEVWTARNVGAVERERIVWRPPALDVTVSVELPEVFAGL